MHSISSALRRSAVRIALKADFGQKKRTGLPILLKIIILLIRYPMTGSTFFSIKSTLSKILGLNVPVIPTEIFFSILT